MAALQSHNVTCRSTWPSNHGGGAILTSSSFFGQIPHQEKFEISVGIFSCANTSILCILPVFGPPFVCGLCFFLFAPRHFRVTLRALYLFLPLLQSFVISNNYTRTVSLLHRLSPDSSCRMTTSLPFSPCFSTTDVATVKGRSACLGLSGFLCITPVGRALDSVASCSIPVSCLICHEPEHVLKYIFHSWSKTILATDALKKPH